jgi:hypothetical protein
MRLINITGILKKGIIIYFLLGIQLALTAQTTELKIIDLGVRSKMQYNITEQNETSQLDTLVVGFKMNKAELVAKIHVRIGNKEGRKNILNVEYPVIQDGGLYYVNAGNRRFQIKGYSTYFEIPINKSDSKDFFYFTIYAEEHSGEVTPELKYKL